MRGPAVVAGLLLAMSVRADPMCPVLPGPFTQGTVCPFPDPSMCFTAQNANVIVQALADVCALTESLDVTLASVAQVAGDLGGTAASPQVVATHLAAPLPGAQGGLGVSQPACAGGQFLSCTGTACTCRSPNVAPYPDTIPSSPNAMDDEFEGGPALDPKWTVLGNTLGGGRL